MTRMNQPATLIKAILIVVLLLVSSCNTQRNKTIESESLRSDEPLAVTHRARSQKFTSGNLIINPSFESGKIKKVDSLTQSIKIDGWSFIGNDIRWLRSSKDEKTDEQESEFLHSGMRSVRIIRKKANETGDFGTGTITDYIRVIPGNYNLSFFINLKNVTNPKSRLGTRMFDAVDIRVICYDKNRLEISPSKYSPYYDSYYDNSVKSLSLANYSRIDSTGWIHVQGKSHCFPVPDGDLQDETKFVRIFIGLKGTGEMCIDDVSYTYSPFNMTCLERVEPYFDSVFSPGQFVLPIPRSHEVLESIILYRPYYKDVFPLILIPQNTNALTVSAARQLEAHIKNQISSLTDLQKDEIPELIVRHITPEQRNSNLIFSIGNTNLFRSEKSNLPLDSIADRDQGFIIHTMERIPGTIFLYGNSAAANLYAVQAALQLFDNGRLLFHNANIIDFPAFENRPLLLTELNENTTEYLISNYNTRFNSLYFPSKSDNLNQLFSDIDKSRYREIMLYLHSKFSSSGNELVVETGGQDIRIPAGVDGVLFFPPVNKFAMSVFGMEKSGYIASNGVNFRTIVQQAKAMGARLEFIPEFHLPGSPGYYQTQFEFHIENQISTVFSGNGFNTWKLDEADVNLFNQKYTSTKTFLDLSMFPKSSGLGYFMSDSLWPSKLPTASFFEPFRNEILPEVYAQFDRSILGFKIDNVFDRIRLRTASDFFWNPGTYNPDLSLYRVLIDEFGSAMAKNILLFNNYYFLSKSELIMARNPKVAQRHLRRASSFLLELENVRIRISPDVRSSNELSGIINELVKEIKNEYKELSNQHVGN